MATFGSSTNPLMGHWNWDAIEYRCAATRERALTVHTNHESVMTCRSCRYQVRLPRAQEVAA
jgi:hypothetical protein